MGNKKKKKNKQKKQLQGQSAVNRNLTGSSLKLITLSKKNYRLVRYKNGAILSVLAGFLIAYYFYYQSSMDTQETISRVVLDNKNQTTIITDTTSKGFKSVIEEIRENRELFKSILQQPASREEYEKDKDIFRSELLGYKDSITQSVQKYLDSILFDSKIVISNINYINNSKWARLFNAGYGLFTVGKANKLYIYQGSFDQNIKLDWSKVSVDIMKNDLISIIIPDVNIINRNTQFEHTTINIHRNYLLLNKIQKLNLINSAVYCGIISDNKNGIMGIIGFRSGDEDIDENIIDFNKLQRLTQIDFTPSF